MAVFSYKALNSKGRTISGVIDAESPRAARQKLKGMGMFPTEVAESSARSGSRNILKSGGGGRGKRVGAAQLGVITRQLATLLAAGMPLVESLRALGGQIDQASIKEVVADVGDKVNEGATLASALKSYPTVFPKLYVNMVAAGEVSGALDLVLERLADLLEAQAMLQRKFISALTYPMLMLLLCFGVIILLLAYVVPQITTIFESRNAILPLPTRVVIGLSQFVQNYWLVMLILIALGVTGLLQWRRSPSGRRKIDAIFLKIPVLGSLRLKIAVSRLSRNLGMMLASGVQLLTALQEVKSIVGNVVLEEALDAAINGVREGSGLAEELNKSQHFPRLLIHMVAIGERTGQLEQMLVRAANVYEAEVDAVVSSFTSILEPVMIVFLALIVGAILAAVMLPMLQMTSLAR